MRTGRFFYAFTLKGSKGGGKLESELLEGKKLLWQHMPASKTKTKRVEGLNSGSNLHTGQVGPEEMETV